MHSLDTDPVNAMFAQYRPLQAKHIKNTNSGHFIYMYSPRLVADAIREVVEVVLGTAESALFFLRKAWQSGYFRNKANLAKLRQDKGFDPLRSRKAFQDC